MIERELYQHIAPVIDSPEAVIITGMRRVGKTTLLRRIWEGIPSGNKLFFDLENPINRKHFEHEDFERVLDGFKYLGLDTRECGFIFLDEIQFVRTLPPIVKYLGDHYNLKFFLTGSASFYLKNLFSESLSGRKYLFELFPLSFREFLAMKNVVRVLPAGADQVTQVIHADLSRYYDEYIHFGGFPGVVAKETTNEKTMMLDDIFSSYFQLEVMQLSDFRKTNVIRDMILLLMERAGSKLDIQKLSKELGVSRATVYEYLSFLEQTYLIRLIRPFSRNRDAEIRNAPKVYLCDTGLLNRFARVSEGALFENAVFSSLARRGEVNYYQRKSGVEVDFIVDKKHAYEVKLMPSQRDVKRLESLAGELGLEQWHIVSKHHTNLQGCVYGFMTE
jgi:predicted AAA+ superfamily ATPase